MFFGFEILVGVFTGVLLATIVVLVVQIRSTSQVNKLTFPAYEYAMKKAEYDAETLIADARKSARTIITDAEQAGHETISGYTTQATEIHEQYKELLAGQTKSIANSLQEVSDRQVHALEEIVASTEGSISVEQKKIGDSVLRTNESITKTAQQIEHTAHESILALQTNIEKVGKDLEKQLHTIETSGEEKLAAHLDAMQKTADAHIATYEASRTKLMDAHIEQLVESVVSKVLHTQLPVSEHASLARAALEEAKSKHIL
jgi:vacuolar-type H+-ATPase subunit H